ncbi:MAG: AraC family transcriptional regulator [Lewinellaceae bacterium]|nr:AraC family transcriptional regulator [Lewinellaceae bacterium]
MVQHFSPHPALLPFIEGFLVMSFYFESESQQTLSARGVPMLVFPFKSPPRTGIRHGHAGGTYPKQVMDEPALLYTSNVFCQTDFMGAVNFVMVMLKPTAAYHFTRSNVQGLSNTVATLDDLHLYRYFDALQEQLWATSDPARAVDLIQRTLFSYFEQNAKIGTGDFTPVLNYMFRSPTLLPVHGPTRKFKCTERWLEKQCAAQTGLAPKNWLRLIRHRNAANYWLHHPNISWMEIVARFNYTDQSHLIRDFKHFSGSPPALHFSQYSDTETGLMQDKVGLSSLIGNRR